MRFRHVVTGVVVCTDHDPGGLAEPVDDPATEETASEDQPRVMPRPSRLRPWDPLPPGRGYFFHAHLP